MFIVCNAILVCTTYLASPKRFNAWFASSLLKMHYINQKKYSFVFEVYTYLKFVLTSPNHYVFTKNVEAVNERQRRRTKLKRNSRSYWQCGLQLSHCVQQKKTIINHSLIEQNNNLVYQQLNKRKIKLMTKNLLSMERFLAVKLTDVTLWQDGRFVFFSFIGNSDYWKSVLPYW